MKRKLLYVSKSILALRSFATMLLFISAISVGWGTNYIHYGVSGTNTGWENATLVNTNGTESVNITLTAGKTYEFLLTNSTDNNGTWWKFSGSSAYEVTSGTEYSLSTSNGQNGKISNATGGTYIFTVKWNNGTPTLTVTFPASSSIYTPVLENPNEISCFFETPSSMTNVYAWIWGSDYNYSADKAIASALWNSDAAELDYKGLTESGKKIWKWTYNGPKTDSPTNIIFLKSRTGSNADKINTNNLTFTNHGYYVYDGTNISSDVKVIETKYSVNISAGEGGTVSPTGDQQVGSTAVDIKAEANTGYTFSNWTTTGGVSVTDANAASTTITATAAGSVKANFTSTSSDAYYLPNSGNNNFERNDNCKFVDGTLTLNLTAGFKFKVCKKTGSSETWYGDGSTISATTTDKSITLNTNDMTLTVTQPGTYTFNVKEISNGVNLSVTYPTSTHTVNVTAGPGGNVTPTEPQTVGTGAVSITATANDGYVFEKWTASSTGIKIADAYSASTTFTATASGTVTANFTATSSDPIYYVVFPDANVGNTARADKTVTNKIPAEHTAFRLIPSRNRNDDTLDEDLVSINLKIDGDKGRQLRYDTNGEIKFYITDGSGNYFKTDALTRANDYLQAKETTKANNNVDYYDTRSSLVWSEQPSFYYTIHKNDAQQAKSLTFMFSKNNSNTKGYIIKKGEGSTTKNEPSNSVDGFGTDAGMKSGNLIVGFLTSRGHGSDYYNDHIKNYGVYLVGQMNGTKYTVDKNYEMKKILYPLGTNDEAAADSIVYSCTVKKGSANWDDFFLSFSTGDKIDDGNLWNLLLRPSVQNEMDGQALEGGVTFFKNDNGTDNAQQALNPLLSAAQKKRYVSYTIYFNATYSTYRIEFHDGFYIAGEAVEESGSYAPEKRIAMSKADLNGVEHYIYTGKFENGKEFAFFLNENTYTVNYCEDDHDVKAAGATATAWDVQAPANGGDYAFYNRVQYNTTGSNGSLGTGKKGMVWGLPTGTYTIRFYNHKEVAGNNQLYTVDKEVLMANVTSTFKESVSTSEKAHNYGGWRTLSDDCALILPNGVKAYYAANVGNGKVYLKELTDGYIPAHCPVILSNPNLLAGTKNIAFPVRPDGYDIQQTLAQGEQNYLVDCYEKAGTVSPEVTVNGTPKYNYFFSYRFKFAGKEMSDVPLGFWKPFAGTATKKNYSYLSVDKQLNPSEYDENTYTFDYNETKPVASSKAYCFVMAFDEDELGDNTTTGIEQVKENVEVDMTNAVWHNMQGVRITKPSAPGMYICNGKKVVVR